MPDAVELLGAQRLQDVEPLPQLAAEQRERGDLVLGFHALGQRGYSPFIQLFGLAIRLPRCLGHQY